VRRLTKRFLPLVAPLVLAAGCSGERDSPARAALPTAMTLGEQTVLTAAGYLSQSPYADADRANGRRQARACAACHTFDQGGQAMLGPNLYGIFGTVAGTRPGFDYSEILRHADFVWTPRALDAWLARPSRFLPGNRMSFIGIANADDRADLIAWLLETAGSNERSESPEPQRAD
jgi:cytochrome c